MSYNKKKFKKILSIAGFVVFKAHASHPEFEL